MDLSDIADDPVWDERSPTPPSSAQIEELKAKFAGPRCEVCGSLCIDLAKDEYGQCPDCAQLGREIAAAGVHT